MPGGSGEFAAARTNNEAALQITADEPMVLQRSGESIGRRSRQPRDSHEVAQRQRSGFEGAKDEGGLVEHTDAATVVHGARLPSHILRRKEASAGRFERVPE